MVDETSHTNAKIASVMARLKTMKAWMEEERERNGAGLDPAPPSLGPGLD